MAYHNILIRMLYQCSVLLAIAVGTAFGATVRASSAKESTWRGRWTSQSWRGGASILLYAL